MKKILLSSLLAVMAVTSANAKIASTGYVDAAEAAANAYTDDEIAALVATTNGNGDFVIDVTQTDGKVTVTKGNIDYSDLDGKPEVDKAMSDSSTNAVQNKVIKSYVDTEVGEKQDVISDLNTIREGASKGATAVQNFDSLTNEAEVPGANDGQYVTTVTQTNGKIKASVVAFDTSLSEDSTNAVQNKAVTVALNGKQNTLTTEQLAAVNSGITEGKVNTYDGYNATITQNTNDIAAITTATVAEEGKEDGQYVLTKKVVDGVITYSWESIDRTLAN